MTSSRTDPAAWWRAAVTYQVYPRSFADGDGDGVGDIAGIRSRLPYIRDLGVDAIWLNPWYPSPMADAGYDVADYRAIDPLFGTLAEAEALIAEARALGLRVLLDIVPNHMSSDAPVVSGRARGGTGVPRAGALPVPTRTWRRLAAAERLGERLRWVRLDADPRARREAGRVVPAPL